MLASEVGPTDELVPTTQTEAHAATAPIEDHAVIGDTRTAALVTRSGEITWLCAPRFDSVPVFGSLIGGVNAGRFSISPVGGARVERAYRQGSATLESTWTTSGGRARLTDAMVADVSAGLLPQLLLVRRLECTSGEVEVEVLFDPRRDFLERPRRAGRRAAALVAEWGSFALFLRTDPDLEVIPGRPLRLRIRDGDVLTFVMTAADREPGILVPPSSVERHVEATDRWWKGWSDGIAYDGASRASVVRSLITLRLLTYAPSGAPVAAPTTSLPEDVGGERNWDYRFAWPRDASLGITSFLGVGKREEARTFLGWLAIASRLSRPKVQVLYDLDGRPGVSERERMDIAGYMDSLPVRIGNAACDQHQLDVYGWIVEAAWELERAGEELTGDVWRAVRGWSDFICRCWREPDAGIWERRGEPQHFVHSKVMAWQALGRAVTLAERYRVSRSQLARWKAELTALERQIRTRGVDADRDIYVQRYGSTELDASLLTLPTSGLEPADAPRMRRTVHAIGEDLSAGDGLLYRYRGDELAGDEGAFLACSFWLVRALATMGDHDEARSLFGSLCARANDVGLFAEQMDPSTGAHLGNFPQALTHSSLVQAALSIDGEATVGRAGDRA